MEISRVSWTRRRGRWSRSLLAGGAVLAAAALTLPAAGSPVLVREPAATETQVRADLARLAAVEEVFAARQGRYASVGELRAAGAPLLAYQDVEVRVAHYTPRSYCLSARWRDGSDSERVLVHERGPLSPTPVIERERATSCTRQPVGVEGGSFSGSGYPTRASSPARWSAAAAGDLRVLAANEARLRQDQRRYGTIAEMDRNEQWVGLTPGVRVRVMRYEAARSYCLSASWRDASGSRVRYYDSLAGGLQPEGARGCPRATRGVGGDTRLGR